MTRKKPNTTEAPTTKRCAIYTRKSHEKGLDQDFNSLDVQRETCLRYIQIQPGWTAVQQTYDDGGFSGKNTDRPAFQRLLAEIEAGKIDIVVVYKLDRFSRSMLDFLKLQEQLEKLGCAVVSVTQNFNTADAMGRLTLNVLMSFAQFEREMTSERIRDKLAASRRRGKWTGGNAPFGYVVKDKRLEVDDATKGTVIEVFELFLEHESVTRVAELLNERGARRPVRNGSALRWTKVAILRLLKNPIYTGLVSYRDETHPGEHAAIVDRGRFDRVQLVLAGRQHARRDHGLNPQYILRGIIRCGNCDSAMVPASTRKGAREYRYYRCSQRNKNGSGECMAVSVPAPAIEEHVISLIAEVAKDGKLATELHTVLQERVAKRHRTFERERAELPARIAAASAKVARLVDELSQLDDGKARQLVQKRIQDESRQVLVLERRLGDVDSGLAALNTAEVDAGWTTRTLNDFSRIWNKLTYDNRKRLLRALVEAVIVREHTNQVQVRFADLSRNADGTPEAAE